MGSVRFIPGAGHGADSTRGIPGADPTGRTTPTGGLPVGEELPFFLEPTRSQQPQENRRKSGGRCCGSGMECRRDGWEPWILAGEVDTPGSPGTAEILAQSLP